MIDVQATIRAAEGGASLDVRLGIDASTVHVFERDVELEVWPIERMNLESRQAQSFLFDVDGSRWVIEPRDATRFVFDALPVLVAPRPHNRWSSARNLLSPLQTPAGIDRRRLAWAALTSLIWMAIFGLGIIVGRLRLDGQNASTWMALILISVGGVAWALVTANTQIPLRQHVPSSDEGRSLPTTAEVPTPGMDPQVAAPDHQVGATQPARWTVRGDPSLLARLLDERAAQTPSKATTRTASPSLVAGGGPPDKQESLPAARLDEQGGPGRPGTIESIDTLHPGTGEIDESTEPGIIQTDSVEQDAEGEVVHDVSPVTAVDEGRSEESPTGITEPVALEHLRPSDDRPEGKTPLDGGDPEAGWIRISIEADEVDHVEATEETAAASELDAASLPRDTPEGRQYLERASSQRAPLGSPDDLTVLHGIGPVFQSWFHDLGIRTFDDLLAIDEIEEEKLRNEFGRFAGRIFREGWRDAVREAQMQSQQSAASFNTRGSLAGSIEPQRR